MKDEERAHGALDGIYDFIKTVKDCLIQNLLSDGALLLHRLQQQNFIQCNSVAVVWK